MGDRLGTAQNSVPVPWTILRRGIYLDHPVLRMTLSQRLLAPPSSSEQSCITWAACGGSGEVHTEKALVPDAAEALAARNLIATERLRMSRGARQSGRAEARRGRSDLNRCAASLIPCLRQVLRNGGTAAEPDFRISAWGVPW